MGPYCKYCNQRCFVLRTIEKGKFAGQTMCLATCPAGMAHDLEITGYTHKTAVNPLAREESRAKLIETNGFVSLWMFTRTATWYAECLCGEKSPVQAIRHDALQWWASHWHNRPLCSQRKD